jgi:hypothetical protein
MAKEVKFPKGTKAADFKGNALVAFGDDERPPQFGVSKAKAIIKMDAAKMDAEDIKEVCCTLGLYKLKTVDAKLIVSGAKALVKSQAA